MRNQIDLIAAGIPDRDSDKQAMIRGYDSLDDLRKFLVGSRCDQPDMAMMMILCTIKNCIDDKLNEEDQPLV